MDSKQRFSSRVDDYARCRPGYPQAIADLLQTLCGLAPDARVADMGAGTGVFSRCLLAAGWLVSAVEPNAPMRIRAERDLSSNPRFRSVDASAEHTTLADRSIDLVTAAQAFHWFDPIAVGTEWRRILRSPGWAALIWNERERRYSAFGRDYHALLLAYATEAKLVDREHDQPPRIARLFRDQPYRRETLSHRQVLDFEGLKGRLMSSSYAPQPGHPRHAPMIEALRALFRQHELDGGVTFEYETRVYLGALLG